MRTQITGKIGEDVAAEYITSKGYFILDRNYHTPYGEIDIVAMNGDDVTFYEVKYRTNKKFGEPDEAISPTKLRKIRLSIEVWISRRGAEIYFENIYLHAIIINSDKTLEEYEL